MNGVDLSGFWPDWQLEEKPLGRGSYGVVYKAVRRDHDVESFAAVKVISIPQSEAEVDTLRSEGLSIDATKTYFEEIVNDFVGEIRLMESFKGVQNIVSVEDYKVIEKQDEFGWDIYIRMELLTPFVSHTSDKTLSEEEVIKLGIDICTALELCAQRSVIHRDIKPQNIFINQFGHYKLGDFGIARRLESITGGLSQKGTPGYMAPEVAKGLQYDARVDIYSLGMVLYQLMNKKRLPFLDTERQLLSPLERENANKRRLDGEHLPAPCEASKAFADLILCATDPDPSKRFGTATAMKRALTGISNTSDESLEKTVKVRHAVQTIEDAGVASANRTSQAPETKQKTVDTFGSRKRSKLPAIIAAVFVVALIAGAAVFVLPRFFEKNDDHDNHSGETSEEVVAENGEAPETSPVQTQEMTEGTEDVSASENDELPETAEVVDEENDTAEENDSAEENVSTEENDATEESDPAEEQSLDEEENTDLSTGAQNSEPLNFIDVCPPYQMDDATKIHKDNKNFLMAGEQYKNAISMYVTSNGTWFLANLKKEYSELQFYLGHIDGSDMGDVTLDIYLDDKLYQSYDVPCSGMPQLITIPVSGVKQLKAYATKDHYCPEIGLGNITIK